MAQLALNPSDGAPGPIQSGFLPGATWRTMREMLHEVFQDMHRVRVMDHMLKPNALFDAGLVASPAQISRALPMSSRYQVQGMSHPCHHVAIYIPAYEVDDLGVGVALEYCAGGDEPDDLLPIPERLMRYVVNNRTGTSVSLAITGEVVELSWQSRRNESDHSIVSLLFQRTWFQRAFRAQRIDFDTLELALLRCTHGEYDVPAPTPTRDPKYPFTITNNCGAMRLRSVLTFYHAKAHIQTIAINAQCDVEHSVAAGDVRHLQQWGLRVLFSQATPVPQATRCLLPDTQNQADQQQIAPIAQSDHHVSANSQCSSAISSNTPQVQVKVPIPTIRRSLKRPRPIQPVTIAPAPSESHFPTSHPQQDQSQLKRLRRQIRKREAAARSHAKRKNARTRAHLPKS